MRKLPILILAASFLLVSCGQKAVKKVDTPGALYVDGVAYMQKKKYWDAIDNFTKIRENYPFDPIALVATVKQGDTYFLKGDYVLAAGLYEEFFNAHPEDENIPYVLRRLAETYEKMSPKSDRDQAFTFKAVERFTYLKNRYGNSKYAKDIDGHLKTLNRKLAANEFSVADFYYRTGRYNAAIIRFEYLLTKFPEVENRDEVLLYLSESYKALRNTEKSQFYLDKLKKEYPTSTFLTQESKKGRKTPEIRQDATQKVPTSAAQPGVTFSYDEKEKRDIDLKPIQFPSVNDADSTAPLAETGQKAGTGADKKGLASGSAAAASSAADKVEGKKDGKSNSLGFFTEKGPIQIDGDSGESLEKGKIIIFKGNVVAKQTDSYLFSDKLTGYVNSETNEIDRVEAEGNVKIVKGDKTATCKQAVYLRDKGQIVLKGDVVVFSGNDKLTGDIITDYINEDRYVVQGGDKDKRARATITPKQSPH
jgi:outer membrane protein assembly factor BamD